MRRPLFAAGNILLLFLLLFLSGSVFAHERIMVPRVWNKSHSRLIAAEWRKHLGKADYYYTSPTKVKVGVYTAYDDKNLVIGLHVTDHFLDFNDDYSLDFAGSDHLRLVLHPINTEQQKEELFLYILPTSKIREPLFKISGLSWHRRAFRVDSVIDIDEESYFVMIAISLKELGLLPLPGERMVFNCLLHNARQSGDLEKAWIIGEQAVDGMILVFQ